MFFNKTGKLLCTLTSIKSNNTISKAIHISGIQQKSFQIWYQSLWVPKVLEPPYRHIVQIGDPVLRQRASPVPVEAITSKNIQFFVQNMITVLRKYKAVGLSAPQIGISLRVIVMEFTEKTKCEFSIEVQKTRQMEVLPLTVFINPEIKVTNFTKRNFHESCESVRGYYAEVPRFEEILLNGYNQDGKQVQLKLNGWNARIAQHEMDHLEGQIYTDVMNRKTLSCSCWQAVNSREGRVNIPFTPK